MFNRSRISSIDRLHINNQIRRKYMRMNLLCRSDIVNHIKHKVSKTRLHSCPKGIRFYKNPHINKSQLDKIDSLIQFSHRKTGMMDGSINFLWLQDRFYNLDIGMFPVHNTLCIRYCRGHKYYRFFDSNLKHIMCKYSNLVWGKFCTKYYYIP